MRRRGRLIRLSTALAVSALTGLSAIGAAPAWAADEVVVDVLKVVDGEYVVDTVTVPASSAQATADRLEQQPDVVAASPAVTYQVDAIDPFWDEGDPGGASHVRDAWSRTRGEGQTVAVLDTATTAVHPDLKGALVSGTDVVGGPGDPWHGTGVAGIVAARAENGIGGAGMAPQAKVMLVRVCNVDGCPSESIARGILWAADHGADVINMSLSGAGYSDVSAAAVRYALDKNISVVASAGNDGGNGNPVMYPAALSGVIGVSSTGPTGTPSAWAEHGWQVDISTVGDSVLLTSPNGGYSNGSGTSFSGPAVAGAAALLRASHPGIGTEDVQAALQAGVDTSNWDRGWGAGRLDVPASLDAADRIPGGVTVTPGPGTADVAWTAVPGATDYTVRVDDVVQATVSGTSAHLTGLVDGTQLAVDVQPTGGDRSRPVLTTVGPAGPGTPTLISAALRGTSTSAVLDLQASVAGPPAPKYAIVRDGVSLGTVTLGLTATPKTVSIGIGAMPAVETHWQLRGVDDLGRTSAASNTVTTAGTRPAPPGAVTGVSAHLVDDQVLLTWDDLGSAYTYRVGVAGDVVASPRTAGTVLPAPAVGETGTWSVVAVDAWGQPGPAVSTSFTRIAPPAMTVAPSVVGTLVVGQTVSTPDAFTGADSVSHIWRMCDAAGCTALTGDVTHLITAAEAGRKLVVEATATNAGGVTSAASAQSGVVASNVPVTSPGAPTIGTATPGDATATVRWSAPASNGGAAILGYSIRVYRSGGWVTTVSAGGDVVSVVVPGLVNGAPHTFTVSAFNSAGSGPESASSNTVTPAVPVVAPGPPVMGTAVPGAGSVRVVWAAPVSDGGAPVQGYTVRAYRGLTPLPPITTTATEQLVTGLVNGATHTFSVTATNAAGTGLAGSVAATPRTVPGAPVIRIPTALPGAAMARWAPPLGDGGSPITGYRVQVYRGASLVRTVDVAAGSRSALVTGLVTGSAHVVVVTAGNVAGAGPAVSSTVVPKVIRRPRGTA